MRKQTLLWGLAILFSLGAKLVYCQDDFWTEETPMLIARNMLSTGEVDGTIYAIGGALSPSQSTSTIEAYDTTTHAWSFRSNLPEALCGSAVCAINDRIYILGGALSVFGPAVSSVYEYTPSVDSFAYKKNIPEPVVFAAASAVNGKIYLIGGAPTGWDTAFTSVYEYNPETDEWISKAKMSTARFCHTATVVDGKIYVFGGAYDNSLTALHKAEVYDPIADEWNTLLPMSFPRFGHAAGTVNGHIFIFGGGANNLIFNYVEEYNPVNGIWTLKSNMPTARWCLSAITSGNRIYAIGGADSLNQGSAAVEVYNPPVDPSDIITGENPDSPSDYVLYQNYPNPFNPTTSIQYAVSSMQFVSLKVYDILGNEIATLVDEYKPAGVYNVEFSINNEQLSSGIYFYKLTAGSYTAVKKMVLMK